MGINIGPKIGIDGEKQFRDQLAKINQSLKTMDAEGRALTATMQGETDAEKKNAAQKELLQRQIAQQKAAVEQIQKAVDHATKAYGEDDVATQKWKKSLYDATAQLATMERQLDDTDKEIESSGEAMDAAAKETKGWADVMKGDLLSSAVQAGWKALTSAITGAAKSLSEFAKEGAEYADTINTLAKQTGLSTDTLQEYKYMEDLLDVSLDTVSGSLSKLTKNMTSARKGTGDAYDAFKELGVAVEDDNGQLRKSEDVFNDVIDALGKIENETERDAKAMTIFGKSAKELNPLITAGSKELNNLRKAAHDSGYVLSGPSLKALQKSQDAMDRLSKSAEAAKNTFAVGLAPGVEKASETMEKALNNPRTQRGLELLSKSLGELISFFADLAGSALPAFFSVLSIGDTRMRYFTDAELEMAASIDTAKQKWEDLSEAYRENAQTIVDQSRHTEALWKELQTLAGESGNVTDADRDRAQFILGELNDALGTEYEMSGNQILRYQTMKSEIGDLIKRQTTLALIEAKQGDYTQAILDREAALRRQTAAQNALSDAWEAYAEKEEQYRRELEETGHSNESIRSELDALYAKISGPDGLQQAYDDAVSTVAEVHKTIARFEDANEAMLAGNYELANDLLTKEYVQREELYEDGTKWSAERLRQEEEAYKKENEAYQAYVRGVQEGLEGMTQKERLAWEQRLATTREELFKQRAFAAEEGEALGEDFGAGFSKGINAKAQEIAKTARSVTQTAIKAVKAEAQIASPSKVTARLGAFFGAGFTKGIEEQEAAARKAAENLSRSATAGLGSIEAAAPNLTRSYAIEASPAYQPPAAQPKTSSTTVKFGDFHMTVYAPDIDNIDQLTERVASRLNDAILGELKAGGLA